MRSWFVPTAPSRSRQNRRAPDSGRPHHLSQCCGCFDEHFCLRQKSSNPNYSPAKTKKPTYWSVSFWQYSFSYHITFAGYGALLVCADGSEPFTAKPSCSRLGQTAPPIAVLRLLRRTFLPSAKKVQIQTIPQPKQKNRPIGRFRFGWGIGIRTPTNRVRVCRATVTQFPNATKILYTKFS